MVLPGGETTFIGDGGLETTMIFERGIELPEFASFLLLDDERGRAALRDYYESYLEIAAAHGVGFTLDTPTWRAGHNWGERLGRSDAELAERNREAVELGLRLREERGDEAPIVVCGTIGPEGDAYRPARFLGPEEAAAYHAPQVGALAAAAADMVSAYTLSYVDDAIGIVRAAVAAGIPVSISFTVETDGRLPDGEALADAVARLDGETDAAAAYLMVNCAHPSHFVAELETGGDWRERIAGIRANASRHSHAELDEMPDLDSGDPDELAGEYRELVDALPSLSVLGGCCGTDTRHVAAICSACLSRRR
ncbi:MAG TPA: homocysteine S-methyltransferase family protein [Solirubrobacterales bacterium]|nr:homocysteine S-methyltransferase family protein [Solirubrobacterales bacterium]